MERFGVLLLVVLGFHTIGASDDWSYFGDNGPEHWPGICKTGRRQSPIHITTEETIKADLGSLKFVRYDFAFGSKITNTGHSVQIQLEGVPIQLEGESLPSTYVLEQMHFHWDAEHMIDGVRDALELHFVHYNSEYGNVSVASQYENGVAVVATLFQLSKEDNRDLKPVLKGAELVSKWVGKNTAVMDSKIIPYLFLPKDHTTYYRYDGSLTTPGCQETVMWFVLTEKLIVSEQQLSVFKNVATNNGTLLFNFRPIQPLRGRKVYHHLEGYSTASSFSSSFTYTVFSILLIKALRQTE